jgi:hypothetical protein
VLALLTVRNAAWQQQRNVANVGRQQQQHNEAERGKRGKVLALQHYVLVTGHR